MVHFACLWVGLPTFPHQLCKTSWAAGGDGQPLNTWKHTRSIFLLLTKLSHCTTLPFFLNS